jgi:hypothetical protein
VLAGAVVAPSAARAQAVVTGFVKDASGAVLPGATVEAASPALIEKVRTAVSDGSGQYRIVDLRPGTYSVTFALAGFNTVKRDGVVLTGSATVVVNADLKIGSVEETITVTGATPLVDVQGIATEKSITRELIDAVPTGRTVQNVAQLIPGMAANAGVAGVNLPSSDVGGSAMGALQQVSIHGGSFNDQRLLMDGLPLNTSVGNLSGFLSNIGSTQEFSIDTSAVSAEDNSGGVRMNIIPREGGNAFHTTVYGDGTGPALQSSNYTSDLAARGFPVPNPAKTMKESYTFNPAGGGPLMKDTLWLYAAANRTHSQTYTSIYPNLNAGNPNGLYVADTSKPQAVFDTLVYGENGRLTWQVTPKNKVAAYYDNQVRYVCPQATSTVSPEAQSCTDYTNQHFISGTYTAPVTSRLLLQAAVLDRLEGWGRRLSPLTLPGATNVNDTVSGITTGSFGPQEYSETANRNRNVVGSASWVTGAHAVKGGLQYQWSQAPNYNYVASSQNLQYTYAAGVPTSLTEFLDPRYQATQAGDTGVFVQDRWTVHHLTLNGGLRFDRFHSYYDAQTLGPSLYAPTRNISFPAGDGVDWKDISYRVGGAYDLFGNGRTAIKMSFNKYLGGEFASGGFGSSLNPSTRIGASTTRSWKDTNGNFIPDCNLQLTTANGECGALANSTFGQSSTFATSYDPAILSGWNLRDDQWEFAASVQQQVLSRLSVDVGYYRRWYGNFKVTDNLAAAPSDFTQFSIVAPTDPRLPDGGGQTIAGLYNINPNKFGQTNNLVTMASNYGDQIYRWQGVDVSATVRAWSGLTFTGGVSTGSTLSDNCAVLAQLPELSATSPIVLGMNGFQQGGGTTTPYCRYSTPYLPQTSVKGLGTYTLPKVGVQISGSVQSSPGQPIAANFNATNAFTQPSLGRVLSGNASNVSVSLVAPGALYTDRVNQLDLRVGKIFRFAGQAKFSANLDLFNLFNGSPVLVQNNNFSTTTAAWQTPQNVLPARLIKLSGQFDF